MLMKVSAINYLRKFLTTMHGFWNSTQVPDLNDIRTLCAREKKLKRGTQHFYHFFTRVTNIESVGRLPAQYILG